MTPRQQWPTYARDGVVPTRTTVMLRVDAVTR